jgi:YegS/Rv2252/BmrU family lipid kinase
MKIKLIINPLAGINAKKHLEKFKNILGAGNGLEKFKSILGAGNELDVQLTKKRYDSFYFSQQSAKEGYDIIVAGGGDGTINQAINGIVHSGVNVPVGFIPLGTSNAYAMSLGLPMDPIKACQFILKKNIKRIDLGRTNSGAGFRYFISMAGAGFDAQTVHSVNPTFVKIFGGILAHIIAGAYSLLTSDRARLHVEIDNVKHECYQIFIFNGKFYGGFIKAAPHADMTDGYLDVYLFQKGKKKDVIRYFSGVVGRYHLKFKDIDYFRAKNVKIVASEEVLVHLDGETIGTLPREFEIYPKGIDVIVP